MGLSLYYITWISATSVPFKQCANVKMKKVSFLIFTIKYVKYRNIFFDGSALALIDTIMESMLLQLHCHFVIQYKSVIAKTIKKIFT